MHSSLSRTCSLPFHLSVQPTIDSIAKWLIAAAVLMTICGCDPPPRPPLTKKKAQSERTLRLPEEDAFKEVNTSDGELPLRFAAEVPFELWEVHFLGGEQIGYAHLQAEPTDRSDEVRYRYTERLQILRGDQLFDSELSQTCIENVFGRLRRFDSILLNNSQRTLNSGVVEQNELKVTVRRDGEEESTRRTKWKPSFGGLLAVQQHLREQPMKRGEKRELNVLAPVIYEPSAIQLEAIGMASVSMLTGESLTLLEVELTPILNNSEGPKTTLWTDEKGNILKQYIPNYGLIIVRTDRETATRHFSPKNDALAAFEIPLQKAIENPSEVSSALFLVKSKSGRDLSSILVDQPGQLVRLGQQSEIQVAVVRDTDPVPDSLAPDEGDRRAGPLVQSNDPLIKAIAAVPPPDTKAALARKLARTVYDHIGQKDNSEGFASAAFVANSGRGDCTEHAVMLTALCRAKGIPARVAAGLVYYLSPNGPAMRYHMWTLVYADDKWIQLDATNPSGLAAADRILIATDNLSSGSEYAVVQAIASLLGDLQVEVGNTLYKQDDPTAQKPDENTNPDDIAPQKPKSSADALEELLRGIDAGNP